MIVDVSLSSVFLLHVAVRDMHVLQCGVVVLVIMGGEQVAPILSPVKIVRDVIVLVAMLQGLMLVMSYFPRHSHLLRPSLRDTRSVTQL
jgi:uncharacterized membrane protein YcaP (DUF421 family)